MSPTFNFYSTSEDAVKAFPSQTQGRTFLITGASAGTLGGHAAIALGAGKPANIILVGRNKAKVEAVESAIAVTDPSVKVTFVQCSLDDQDSVRKAAEEIRSKFATIDVVLNNAGVMAIPWTVSPQGIELQFAANHIGHFLLTNLIIDRVLAAAAANGGSARIVNHSSIGHKISPVRLTDYNFAGGEGKPDGSDYHMWSAYGQSKTANALYTVELARRLGGRGVQSYSCHPGEIWDTALTNHLNEADINSMQVALAANGLPLEFRDKCIKKSITQGSMTQLVAALDPAIAAQNGCWLADGQIQPVVDPKGPGPFNGWNEEKKIQVDEVYTYAVDKSNAATLWALSEKLVGQKFDI